MDRFLDLKWAGIMYGFEREVEGETWTMYGITFPWFFIGVIKTMDARHDE